MAIGTVRVDPAARSSGRLRFRELLDHERFLGPAFVTPALLLLLLLVAYPFVMALYFALSNAQIGRPSHWVGLQNFVGLWESDSFRQTFQNAFVFTGIAVAIKVVLGITLALILNEHLWFKRLMRGAVLLPWVIPTALSTLGWWWMFNSLYSVVNWSGIALGMMDPPGPNWLGQKYYAMAAVVAVNVWRGLPFFAITILAGLVSIRSDPDRYKVGRLFHRIAPAAVRLNPFWDFRVVDDVHPDPRRPYVFVANHQSNADAFLVAMVPWEMKWLSKKSIFDIPLLGWMMHVAGDVEVDRGNKESARKAMAEMRERLSRKLSVLIFPQGTRSPDGTVGSFREGAFRLAIENGVDVVPLAVAGTAESLPKGSLAFKETAATVTVLPPVSTKGMTLEDAPKLAEEVRAQIARSIERPT